MRRISLFILTVSCLSMASIVRAQAGPDTKNNSEGKRNMTKAVVHINFGDSERQKHGLKNISNVLKAAKGSADVVVVCHGQGIGLLVKGKTTLATEIEGLMKQKVHFLACENTMKEKGIAADQLLPGAETVPSGAFEIIRRQHDGFAYFRP